jgi:Domain of unknown function (DUF4382)
MPRCFSFREAITAPRFCLLVTLFLCVSPLGCGNSCFVFVSNPGGSLPGTFPSCQLNTATGAVRVRINSSATPATADSPGAIKHIFVTLRGIQATPSALADDASPEWQELAPKLAAQPVQLDLLERGADSCERNAISEVSIRADAYRQFRLRLSTNQPATDEPVPAENACGSAGLNCVVTAESRISPLELDGQSSQIQVGADHIAGGFFRVLPNTTANLQIELNPQSSLIFSADDPVRLVPVFTVQPQAACESTATPNQ